MGMTARVAVYLSLGLTLTAGACGGGGGESGGGTYWQDVAPIYYDKCVRCHQEGGIAPFRLDEYASARAHASAEAHEVEEGTMPPYFMVHDGSCGSFDDEATRTDAEKATIVAWARGARAEGTPGTIPLPERPALADAVSVSTPSFAPVPQGGQLAEYDEYRCFLLDNPGPDDQFLIGYNVVPGEPAIVHHAIGFLIDPQEVADSAGHTNGELMAAMDAESPDRLGWPCFGGAGDGLSVYSIPIAWAPGQGVVRYPDGMGVPVKAGFKLVVQLHYNLADPASAGKIDSTTIEMRFAPTVDRKIEFLLSDPFLDSLAAPMPASLPAGKKSTSYTWAQTARQMGVLVTSDLLAVMPHMHGRGLRQTMTFGPAGGETCVSHVEGWDFHWQEVYFFRDRPKLTPSTRVQVTCEYDTSKDTAPVLPGWGTRNEMCLNALMIALPAN
jgi:hypothetical protein